MNGNERKRDGNNGMNGNERKRNGNGMRDGKGRSDRELTQEDGRIDRKTGVKERRKDGWNEGNKLQVRQGTGFVGISGMKVGNKIFCMFQFGGREP